MLQIAHNSYSYLHNPTIHSIMITPPLLCLLLSLVIGSRPEHSTHLLLCPAGCEQYFDNIAWMPTADAFHLLCPMCLSTVDIEIMYFCRDYGTLFTSNASWKYHHYKYHECSTDHQSDQQFSQQEDQNLNNNVHPKNIKNLFKQQQ